jgi:hypothetical protein
LIMVPFYCYLKMTERYIAAVKKSSFFETASIHPGS